MKWCVTGFLLLVLCAGVRLHAQLSGTNTIESVKVRAGKGDAAAQFTLGYAYENGQGVATNSTEAFKWYSKAAEQTNAEAEFHLGLCYLTGRGLPPEKFAQEDIDFLIKRGFDPSTAHYIHSDIAVNWFRKAALQNYAPAQYYLGNCYFNSNGIAQDYGEAVKWYRKAAEQGNAGAQFCLGICSYFGCGMPKDYAEAANWYRKAAEQGTAGAQYGLGDCYRLGTGVSQDSTEAAKWYRMAAEQGDAKAQHCLAGIYALGNGVPKDYAEAFKWIYKAADQGDDDAQYAVGFSYLVGIGIPKDNLEAYKWFNLAAARGNQLAKTELETLEQQMTMEQITEAQKLTREYKPGASAKTADSLPKETQQEPQLSGNGTGFFITDDGYLISNYHVVKDATKVRLLTSVGLIDAKVVQVDAANDLALLKARGVFSPLPIAASRTVRLGNTVATVGFPDIGLQGFAPKLAKGEIASLSGASDSPRYFQISVPVQPGNSGGALVDERGNVVGIVSAKLSARAALAESGALPENVNYAVKSSFILGFLESMPDVSAKLKAPVTADRKFEDVVKSAQDAAVLVLVY